MSQGQLWSFISSTRQSGQSASAAVSAARRSCRTKSSPILHATREARILVEANAARAPHRGVRVSAYNNIYNLLLIYIRRAFTVYWMGCKKCTGDRTRVV